MIAFAVIFSVVAYAVLLVFVLNLNYQLYKRGEALAEAQHRANRAALIVGDLVEDERRRQQAAEREFLDWLTGGRSG